MGWREEGKEDDLGKVMVLVVDYVTISVLEPTMQKLDVNIWPNVLNNTMSND